MFDHLYIMMTSRRRADLAIDQVEQRVGVELSGGMGRVERTDVAELSTRVGRVEQTGGTSWSGNRVS